MSEISLAFSQVSDYYLSVSGLARLTYSRQFCRVEISDPDAQYIIGDGSLGYSSGIALKHDVEEWLNAHKDTLERMTCVQIALRGGVDFHITTPRAACIWVKPHRNRPDDSPAKAFEISYIDTVHKDEEIFLRDCWEEVKESCDRETARIRSRNHNPNFVGVIAIVVVVIGTGFTMYPQFTLLRPRGIDDTALDEATRTGLEDFIKLCKAGISCGHSYYAPPGHDLPEPLVGHLVRRSKRSWKRIPVKGAPWDMMATYMAERPNTFKSGLSPRSLWLLARMV